GCSVSGVTPWSRRHAPLFAWKESTYDHAAPAHDPTPPTHVGRLAAPELLQGKRIWKWRGFSDTVAASFTSRSLLHSWRTLYGYACACLVSGAFCHVDLSPLSPST